MIARNPGDSREDPLRRAGFGRDGKGSKRFLLRCTIFS
jgi:hypothetical protein